MYYNLPSNIDDDVFSSINMATMIFRRQPCNKARYTALGAPKHLYKRRRYGLRDGWMDGRMDGWMDGRTDGWTDGQMDSLIAVPHST